MDLGFLSGLIGGEGKDQSMLTALLPMLLGGKFSQNGNAMPNDILSSIFKGGARENIENYPPLFGGSNEVNLASRNNLSDILGRVLSSPVPNRVSPEPKSDYPYELQYNRPYTSKTRDK
ncbi:MAG: hypothetical protein J6U39_05285 [Clostridia bacterium]|nr:hypothetical protein [Clostridia bacterium]